MTVVDRSDWKIGIDVIDPEKFAVTVIAAHNRPLRIIDHHYTSTHHSASPLSLAIILYFLTIIVINDYESLLIIFAPTSTALTDFHIRLWHEPGSTAGTEIGC